MAYAKDSWPVENASKLGHIKLIESPNIRRLISQFEATEPLADRPVGYLTGHVDLSIPAGVDYVIAIDGGQAVVPNSVRREKRLAWIKVSAVVLRMEDLNYMRSHPLMDPRDTAKLLVGRNVWTNEAVLPLAGVSIPGESVRETVRKTIDDVLHYTGLYSTLQFLVSREWDPSYQMPGPDSPNFACPQCGVTVYVPRSRLLFSCTSCGCALRLADYLGVTEETPEAWSREEVASAFRNVLETLTLFYFLRLWWERRPSLLERIVFIKDGPLLLRAQLSRLVEPIRTFIACLRDRGVHVSIAGIEKTGDVVNHLDDIKTHLPNPGDFFLPSVRYLVEEIAGYAMPSYYRNRVQYGAKVVVRLGPQHVLPLNVPTGQFLLEPKPEDLIGFEKTVRTLKELLSYRYENAILPLIVSNSLSSIAYQPSSEILKQYMEELFSRQR